MHYISEGNLIILLDILRADYEVYFPVRQENRLSFKRYTDSLKGIVVTNVRSIEPLKAFFTRARETAAEGFSADIPHNTDKPYAIVGVKACDLQSLKIQDCVYKDKDCPDPLYSKTRENNLIIAADCSCVLDTCFCAALGIQPYPTGNFDFCLSPATDGFIIEAGSEKAEELVRRHSLLFQGVKKDSLARREQLRAQRVKEVERNVQGNNIPSSGLYKGMISRNFNSPLWEEEAKKCVECAACNAVCPTCHCFLLYDQKRDERMARFRIWDSCMLKDFARVAGGANPRAKLWMRLRNRFEKKFDFFPRVCGEYACTGCGRCIAACPAKIDIRKVLRRLVNND